MNKLISMVEKIQDINDNAILGNYNSDKEMFDEAFSYACFLMKLLELGMFVPVSESGEVLEKPESFFVGTSFSDQMHFEQYENKYQKALEKVIFKGFEVETSIYDEIYTIKLNGKYYDTWDGKKENFVRFTKYKTIEDLTHLNLELTPNAINKWKSN